MLTFEELPVGVELGPVSLPTGQALDAYQGLFSSAAQVATLPPGLLVALLMRGYLAAVADRPNGNVHAGQALHWGPPVPRGTRLSAGVVCIGKELKKGRRWVRFEVTLSSSAGTHVRAVNTTIWGA